MKLEKLISHINNIGTELILKPKAADAYGIEKPLVKYLDLKSNSFYKTPWVFCEYYLKGEKKQGAFKLSDF